MDPQMTDWTSPHLHLLVPGVPFFPVKTMYFSDEKSITDENDEAHSHGAVPWHITPFLLF